MFFLLAVLHIHQFQFHLLTLSVPWALYYLLSKRSFAILLLFWGSDYSAVCSKEKDIYDTLPARDFDYNID